MNSQCPAITRSGERCRKYADSPDGYCWAHSPANAERRRQAASRAGKARHDQEVRILKEELKATIAGVRDGSIDRNDAGVVFQGYRALKDYIALERDTSILPELSERIEELRERRNAS